jgi:hypothetical protein
MRLDKITRYLRKIYPLVQKTLDVCQAPVSSEWLAKGGAAARAAASRVHAELHHQASVRKPPVAWNRKSKDLSNRGESAIMGLFSKDIQDLNDLFVHQLQDIYYAEQQIVQNLPKMIEKATNSGLKQGLSNHLRETEQHVERLKQSF